LHGRITVASLSAAEAHWQRGGKDMDVVVHAANHTGEISTVKGLQGQRGYAL